MSVKRTSQVRIDVISQEFFKTIQLIYSSNSGIFKNSSVSLISNQASAEDGIILFAVQELITVKLILLDQCSSE
jgi:hypothetical protein